MDMGTGRQVTYLTLAFGLGAASVALRNWWSFAAVTLLAAKVSWDLWRARTVRRRPTTFLAPEGDVATDNHGILRDGADHLSMATQDRGAARPA